MDLNKKRILDYARKAIEILIDLIAGMFGSIAMFLISELTPWLNEKLLIRKYSDFTKEGLEAKWSSTLDHIRGTSKENIEFVVTREEDGIKLTSRKRKGAARTIYEWEGGQIRAKKAGFNLIRVKVKLNFVQSTARKGNIAVWALGNKEKYRYLIGIDRASGDIFAHCMDDKNEEYIKERARTHFKDFNLKEKRGWIVLGLEWKPDGIKYFVSDEKGEFNDEYLFKGPLIGEIRNEILEDAWKTYWYGIKDLWIRLDIVSNNNDWKEIVGKVEYVETRRAPLSYFKLARKGK